MQSPKLIRSTLALVTSLCLSLGAFASDRPEIKQQVDGFKRPVAAVFSPSGKSLYVINHAQGEAGTLRSESFVSKLTVESDESIKVDRMKFLEGLTAPIDIDFSPVAFGKVPAGTLFLLAGSPLIQDEAGRTLKDLSRAFIGLIAVDPRTGSILKRVDLSPNSATPISKEKGLLAPASLAFDEWGNLFIAELGVGGHMFAERQIGRAGLWRVSQDGLSSLLSGEKVNESEVEFIPTSAMPVDLCYDGREGMMNFITNNSQGLLSGSVFRIDAGHYRGISSMQTIVRELSALSGLQLMPSGRVLVVASNGELQFPKGKKDSRPIRFRPKTLFSSPGKIGVLKYPDGHVLVAVPEQSSDAGLNRGQRISIVSLPIGY